MYFWKRWEPNHRNFFLALLTIFSITIIWYLYAHFNGAALVIGWDTISQLDRVELVVDSFQVGLFEFNTTAENFVLNHYFQGSSLEVNPITSYLFLLLQSICLVVVLAVLPTFKRFWYIVGMVVFMAILLNFKLEQLQLFGQANNTALILILLLYIPLSYYFHAFNSRIGFFARLITFSALTILMAVMIYYFAQVNHPFLYLSAYGFFVPLIISVIFIFMVAHEIVVSFLFITSGTKNNIIHFLVLTLVYLGNLLLIYFHQNGTIDWNIYYLDEFLLLIVSIVLGLWGFKNRQVLYESIMDFHPYGAYLYVVGGIVCFATMGYSFTNSNDPTVENFQDAIVFSHIGFGFTLILYILSNFLDLMRKNLPVFKVMYKPQRMPFFMARFSGVIVVLAFFILANQVPLDQGLAGYYNGLADLYRLNNQSFLAEQYYKNGSQYAFRNHRSNYTLASMARQNNDEPSVLYYLSQAVLKNPTPYAYINLSNVYKRNDRYFDALFTLNKGWIEFPGNPAIANNLSLLYGQTSVIDSALYYLDAAQKSGLSRKVTETNILQMTLKKNLLLDTDSLANNYRENEYLPILANSLAYLNREQVRVNSDLEEGFLKDSILDLHSLAYIYNYCFNQLSWADTTLITSIKKLKGHSANVWCKDDLQLAEAFLNYTQGNIARAFLLVEQLQQFSDQRFGYYNNLLGLWSMQQGAPRLARDYFVKAASVGYQGAEINAAVVCMEAGLKDQARKLWSNFPEGDTTTSLEMLSILEWEPAKSDTASKSEAQRYQWSIINQDIVSTEILVEFMEALEDDTKATIWLDRIEWFLELGKYRQAKSSLPRLEDIVISQTALVERKVWISTQLAAIEENVPILEQAVDAWPKTDNRSLKLKYLQAIKWDKVGFREQSEEVFQQLGYSNPFFETAVIRSARFYNEQVENEDVAYDMLLRARQVNPYSVVLAKAYIDQCLKLGLTSYADLTLERLRELMTLEEWKTYKAQLEMKKQLLSEGLWRDQ